MKLRLSVLVMLGFSATLLWSQATDPSKALSQYIKTAYSAEDGVKEALDIVQDRNGYIWIATYDGPIRFDGVSFTIPGDIRGTTVPGSARVFCMDAEGALWIGSNNQGLVRYRNQRYDFFDMDMGLPNNSVRQLLYDSHGRIWIGTVAGLAVLEGDTVRSFSDYPELHGAQIMFLREDNHGTVWIGTNGVHPLYAHDSAGLRVVSDPLLLTPGGRPLVNMLPEGNSMWLVSDRYLQEIQAGSIVASWELAASLPENTRFSPSLLYQDSAGVLWLGGDGGLLRLHEQKLSFFSNRDGLSDTQVSTIFNDLEGNLWIGTGRGLDKFSGSKFIVYGPPEGLVDPSVNAVLTAADGTMWLGTNNGIGFISPGSSRVGMLSGIPELVGRIRHMIEDSSGVLWASVYGSGLYGWKDGQLVYSFSTAQGLAGNRVRTIMEASDGSLYVGTTTGLSIVSADRKTVRSLGAADGMAFQYVMCLHQDRSGRIWIGSDGSGVQVLENGSLGEVLNQQSGLAGDVVFRFLEHEGDIFITTAGGITRVSGSGLFNYTSANGLPVDAIFEIVPDRQGRFWLTSSSGIARIDSFDFNAVRNGSLASLSHVFFDTGSGLRDLPMSTAWSAIDRDGTIWFPTQSGAARIDPLHIPSNEVPPPVVIIDSVFIDGVEYERSDKSRMQPAERKIDLAFTALSFVAPEKVLLQYKLEGFDEDWSPLGRKREATYTNLAPGNYRFMVRAVNNDGVYSTQAVSFQFRKLPWLYQMLWIQVLIAILVLGVFVGLAIVLHRIKTRMIRQKLARQEKELQLERKALEFERKAKQIEIDLKNSYSRFVPPEFISILERSSILDVQLGDQVQKQMTILFADIRSFATMAEKMSPSENFNFLNLYLQTIEPVLKRNNGFIDKYVGDAIMALFPGSPRDAVQAGVELQQSVYDFNLSIKPARWPEVRIGIGVH
ncbi:MAG: hypothetical protein KKC64_02315, partial [Spirochaetes bacterium]|nr:hypothetical protein [Spirochaetota bacterium]